MTALGWCVVTALRDQLAAATAGRSGWSSLVSANSHAARQVYIRRAGGVEGSGDVVGNPDGWWWSVWHAGNPVRSISGEAASSAAAAVRAVESLIEQVMRRPWRQCGECKASVDTRHLDGCGGQFHEEFVADYRGGAA